MKDRSLIKTILAALLFFVALGAYALWYGALGAKSANLAALTAEVAQKNASVAQAQESARELSNLSSVKSELAQYFVAPDSIVTFLEGLQSLGTRLGTSVAVVSVAANPTPRPHLDLALSALGSFDSVMRTVGAIEYSPYDITVKSLTLDNQGSAAGDWTAAITLSVGTASSTPKAPQGTATTTP